MLSFLFKVLTVLIISFLFYVFFCDYELVLLHYLHVSVKPLIFFVIKGNLDFAEL